MIYFDNAATSYLKPECVPQAVYEAIRTLGSGGRGFHSASLDSSRVVFQTRCQIAALFALWTRQGSFHV